MKDEELIEGSANNDERQQPEAVDNKISYWLSCVEKARKHWEPQFKCMREDMAFARGVQWIDQTDPRDSNERYIVNIVHRHLRQREAALYAKNPTAVAKRRETLDFQVWDGSMESIMQAQQAVQMAQQAYMAQQPLPPGMDQQIVQAQELLQDYQTGMQYRQRISKMGKTLEIIWEHQIGEQIPPFKRSMKLLVRRTLTTCVGYLKLGYHRYMEYRPEDVARVNDMSEQVAALEAGLRQMEEGSEAYESNSVELAELRDTMQKVTQDREAYQREGLDFDYPQSTSIIIDPSCYQLEGFLGARWVAQEYMLTAKQVNEVYGVKIDKFIPYDAEGNQLGKDEIKDQPMSQKDENHCMVWEVWDKHLRQTFTICQGYDKYLVEPKTPDVNLERFWPFFTLTFNGTEDENNIFPPSDVELLRPMQQERNLMRQRMREHRDAARPGYVAQKGRLDEEDKAALGNRNAHTVVELNGLAEQDDIRRILQAIPVNPIDPNQYETASIDDDTYKAVGTQEAVVGGLSGASATETSIGESARLTAIGSSVDDLDDFLTEVTHSASQLLLMEMPGDLATEIAGRGAVWPDLSGEDISRDLWLQIRAGSSGRPNKAVEIQNIERLAPFIMQIPGIKPKKFAEKLIERLDDRLEIEELYDENLPSIMAMNRMDQMSTGDAMSDPNQQGAEGADRTSVEQGDANMGPRPPAENRNMDPNRP